MSESIATATVRFVQTVCVLVLALVFGYLMSVIWYVGGLYVGVGDPGFASGAGFAVGALIGGAVAYNAVGPGGGLHP